MKQRIQLSILLSILLTMVFVLTVSMHYVSTNQTQVVRQNLQDIMKVLLAFDQPVSKGQSPQEYGSNLDRLLHAQVRVTILDVQGEVLFDSQEPVEQLENHQNRPELQGALQNGYGEDIRRSNTTGLPSLYLAMPMGEGLVLRFCAPLSIAHDFIYTVLPPILLFCLLLVLAGAVVSERLSQALTSPYRRLADSLDHILTGKQLPPQSPPRGRELEELVPILNNIQTLSDRLEQYVAQVQEKSREIENIISTVDDGVLVLDRELEVLTVNRKASQLLPTNGNFAVSCRHPQLLEQVRRAVETGEPSFLTLEIFTHPDRTYRCLISPALGEDRGVSGVVLLITDITEIKKLEGMRSEFVSNFSHEMKSPLTSIKGFAELMKNDMVSDPAKIKEYLSIIITETTRLVNLINDMLKLSELETQSRTLLNLGWVDLRETAQTLRTVLTFQAEAKEVEIQLQGQARLWTDGEKLSEILLNLMDNAVKYNRMGGRVTVSLWEEGETVGLRVRDTGVGIPPESVDRVFERFYRVDKARSRKSGSTGLGLSIVKHDVELLGGSISVKSKLGEFTEMTVLFPKGRE